MKCVTVGFASETVASVPGSGLTMIPIWSSDASTTNWSGVSVADVGPVRTMPTVSAGVL